MKKFYTLLLLSIVCLSQTGFSQDRHRLKNKEPYDIFYIAKPFFLQSKGNDLTKNYNNGAGINLGLEYQFQELNLGLGFELGYAYINPNSYKIKYLPRKYLFTANQIPFTVYTNYYLHNEATYYNFLDRIKPYVGLGLGVIWGRYDYSLSSDANKSDNDFGYYLREYEGQSGLRVGLLPRAGIIFATEQNAFGFELGYQTYFSWDRLEPQSHLTLGLTYVYIIE